MTPGGRGFVKNQERETEQESLQGGKKYTEIKKDMGKTGGRRARETRRGFYSNLHH